MRAAGVRPPGAVGCVPGDGDGPTGVIGTTLTPGRLTPDGGALGIGPLGPWAGGPDGSTGSGILIGITGGISSSGAPAVGFCVG